MGRAFSRAASTTSDNLANFGVTAYLNDGTGYAAGLTPDFMYNQLVEKAGSAWAYNPIKYRHSDAAKKVSFFAYSPYVASAASAVDNASAITAMSSNADQGDPTITFEVGTDVSKFLNLFSNCKSLKNIPESLFANCGNAETFAMAFGWCPSLEKIPEKNFS